MSNKQAKSCNSEVILARFFLNCKACVHIQNTAKTIYSVVPIGIMQVNHTHACVYFVGAGLC